MRLWRRAKTLQIELSIKLYYPLSSSFSLEECRWNMKIYVGYININLWFPPRLLRFCEYISSSLVKFNEWFTQLSCVLWSFLVSLSLVSRTQKAVEVMWIYSVSFRMLINQIMWNFSVNNWSCVWNGSHVLIVFTLHTTSPTDLRKMW